MSTNPFFGPNIKLVRAHLGRSWKEVAWLMQRMLCSMV
jgi:hypothetical protein